MSSVTWTVEGNACSNSVSSTNVSVISTSVNEERGQSICDTWIYSYRVECGKPNSRPTGSIEYGRHATVGPLWNDGGVTFVWGR